MSAVAVTPSFAPRFGSGRAVSARPTAPAWEGNHHQDIKLWLWIYFWLLIFEGGLRKWTFASAANIFLVVRDPVALLIYFKALQQRIFPFNTGMILIGLLSAVGLALGAIQVVGDQLHPLVAAYGWRCDFLQLPMIFVIPRVLTFPDLQKLGRWILWLSIPMTILMVFQFWLPPTHWLNASAIEGRIQITSAVGRVRPPGTFSFITGPAAYYPLVIAFLFAALSWRQAYSFTLRLASALCVILVLPVSGSRAMMASCLIVLVVACVGIFKSEEIRRPLLFLMVIAGVALPLFSFTPIFKSAVEVFQERWAAAADFEGEGRGGVYGMTKRTYGDLTGFIDAIPDTPAMGDGLGVGTNVGAVLLSNRVGFQLAEAEWPRIVQECGPVLGLMLILMRLSLTGFLFITAWRAFQRDNNVLAWLLFAASAPLMLYGQTGQPTGLGFMVFGAGLCLAAARNPAPLFDSARGGQVWV
jgi:hypothetical protein